MMYGFTVQFGLWTLETALWTERIRQLPMNDVAFATYPDVAYPLTCLGVVKLAQLERRS